MAVCAITILAAMLRLATLGLQSYEFDEGATLYVIRGSFTHMLHGVARYESTPPLYYVLAWVWSQVFGTGETGLRLFSALAGVATVPIVYLTGRTLGSRRIGLVAAAIVATSPYLVFYSQEARSYALFTLLSTAGLLCCVRAIQYPTARTLGLWAALSILAFETHYFALFPWLAQVVALAVFGCVPRRSLGWAIVAVGLASVPLFPLVRHQAAAGHADWIGASSLPERIRVMTETFALGATFRGTLSHSVLAAFGVFAVAMSLAIAAAGFLLLRRAASQERRVAQIASLIGAVSVGLPLVAALVGHDYFVHKNLIPFVPVVGLLLAAGLGCERAGRVGMAGTMTFALAGTALTLMSFAIPSLRRPDIRQLSDQLGAPARQRVLVFIPRWQILLQSYQGPLDRLPQGGRRVSEVDVFTAGTSIPARTVPQSFRLIRVQHGNTFTLFSFRSREPLTVTPDELGQQTFSESRLQPISVVQTGS